VVGAVVGSLDGMQGVRGSNPLSSTPGQRPCSGPTVPESLASGSRSAAIYAARPGPTAQGDGDTTALARAVSPWRPSPTHHRELGKHPRTAPDGLILQLGGHGQCPWLSVDDRCRPMLRARRGHVRRGRRSSKPAGDGRQLDRRARPVLGDRLLRWQASRGRAAVQEVRT
jgi:hypothetical protein